MAASVPCPSASGATLKTRTPASKPPSVVETGISQLRSGRAGDAPSSEASCVVSTGMCPMPTISRSLTRSTIHKKK